MELVAQTPDPKLYRCLRSWTVGIDIGQSSDPTAVCAVESVKWEHREQFGYRWNARSAGESPRREHHIRALQRLPLGISYPDQCTALATMLATPELRGAQVFLDASGVGKPVSDLFMRAGIKHTPIWITGGRDEQDHRDGLCRLRRDPAAPCSWPSQHFHADITPELSAMSDLSLASIGIKIESTGAEAAAQGLGKLADAGDKADEALRKAGDSANKLKPQLGGTGDAAAKAGQGIQAATVSAKQYAQALRLLPIQIHQAFDQLLYGTNPLIVLSTQLPQISESFGGVGNALRAVAGYITPAAVGFTALATAAGAAAGAAFKISEESDTFARSLITTGNAAGLTVSQLLKMRQAIQDIGGVTRGDAVSALNATLSAGITKNVEQIAQVAAQLQELGGQSIAATVKQFAALGQDPVKASEALQRSLNFLTPATYDEIVALAKSGDTAKAAALAQDQLTRALSDQVVQLRAAQGGFSELGDILKSLASKAFYGLGDFLIPSNQKIIDGLNARIEALKQYGTKYADTIAALNREIAALQVGPSAASAAQSARNATGVAADIQANSPAQVAAQVAARQQLESLLATTQSNAIARALQADLATTQRYDQLLDAEHAAHLIADKAYYDAKEKLVDIDTQRQVEALQDQNQLLERQNAQIRAAAQAFADAHSGPADAADVTRNWAQADAEVAKNQETILANQDKINQLNADGANKVRLLGLSYRSVGQQAAEVLANLKASEQSYLETLNRSYQLQLEGISLGPEARQRLQDIAQINAQALEQRQQLDQAKRINPELPNYDAQLKAIEDAHQKALDDTDAYYKALDAAQSNWLTGAQAALATYEESARNVAALTETAFTDAFQSIEDSIVNFATTGKFSFKDLANSIMADLARMEVKILESKALDAIFGAFFSASIGTAAANFGSLADLDITKGFTLDTSGFPGAATGGPISGPTIVGEKGPELFIPDTSGYVVPNDQLRAMGGGGITIINNNSFGSGATVAAITAELDRRDAQIKSDIANSIYRGAWKPILQRGLS